MKPLRVFFTGVGGQGTLTATKLLAETALDQGVEVNAGEIHGMAQRGGVVHSFVLLGGYASPKISLGEAHVLLGFEPMETLRALPFIAKDGLVLSSEDPVPPISVTTGREEYPSIDLVKSETLKCSPRAKFLPCLSLAKETGVVQTANTVLMGAFFSMGVLPFGLDILLESIEKRLKPKLVDVNLKAARLGAEYITRDK
ncbi:indolepyruvate oxidoreductase subunit beta [Desulfonatronovibrio magnus]|uniref:indolepyruvate oxidoreductase subunit beta n=1 Tax=Desulfonatronovibrio magnus TaxID=698827 RepID=UPI0005EBD4FE|nr:indolepyruvate oxidoreductase subunit beta [Desulfonatronovibrio magnus]RQD65499.1 MAG: indolepyruvate ferredoxin oxidoreductase [Desulfonatronovibrio sp. MSAO_Bac4]